MNGRFCILGDLNQSILDEGITDWDSIKHSISDANKAQTFQLDTNYRSTKQIIDFANKILIPYTKDYLPKSINRMGKDVVTFNENSKEAMLQAFATQIDNDMQELNTSIGVIVFDTELLDSVSDLVYAAGKKHKVSENQIISLDEHKRIHYIPKGVYITKFDDCKGLEFAKVHILGLDVKKVSTYSEAKKAFVASTRAMNELVLYTY
jgi:DNA helicase-2/ATP-dependent DNA helicase PcrA